MSQELRAQLLETLRDISVLMPTLRFGQLVVNISYMAGPREGPPAYNIWNVVDADFLAAARRHLLQLVNNESTTGRPILEQSGVTERLFITFGRLAEAYNNIYVGQLVASVAYWALGPFISSIWDVEDVEFLIAMESHFSRLDGTDAHLDHINLSNMNAEQRMLRAQACETLAKMAKGKYANYARAYNIEKAKYFRGEVDSVAPSLAEFVVQHGWPYPL
jgi:hypothetical protein